MNITIQDGGFLPTRFGEEASLVAGVNSRNQDPVVDPIEVRYYLSADTILDDTDTFLGSETVVFRDDFNGSATLTLPALALDPGDYTIITEMIVPEGVPDDPSDNIQARPYTVLPPRPDITVTADPTEMLTIAQGSLAEVTVTVTNNGLAPFDDVVFLYLSDDDILDDGDTYLTFDQIGTLAPGESRDVLVGRTLGLLDDAGTYTLLAEVSPDFLEIDATDNVAVAGTLEITPALPDLNVFFVQPMILYDPNPDPEFGGWRTQFQNRGLVEFSGRVAIELWASSDGMLDANDVLLSEFESEDFTLGPGDDTFAELPYFNLAQFFNIHLDGRLDGQEVQYFVRIVPTETSPQDLDLANNVYQRAWSDTVYDNDTPFVRFGADTGGLGTNFNDFLIGSDASEVLNGRQGNDDIVGGAGDDTIFGGPGDDFFRPGEGRDVLDGGTGTDEVIYELATGRVLIDLMRDVSGDGFARFFDDGAGDGDTFANIENARGGAFADNLRGDNGANLLQGLGVSDRLYGRGGNDTLDGGEGADALYGNLGADVMTGGPDAGRTDRFIYFNAAESGVGAGNRDVITDFVTGEDRIELSRIDADLTQGFKQRFEFIGNAAFSGTGGELRYEQSGGITVVQADRDGDGLADFEIELTGTITLTEADFLI